MKEEKIENNNQQEHKKPFENTNQDGKNQNLNYKYHNDDNKFQNKKREQNRPNQNNTNNFQKRDSNRFQNNNNNNDKNWQKDRNNQNNNYKNNGQNHSKNGYNNNMNNNRFNNRHSLDDKGIEKNIKNIISVETNIEEKSNREYNRNMDKQKDNSNNKYDETRGTKKKNNRKNQGNESINEAKLKRLKQRNNLSNMFEDQEDSMLDYYDLTTERGRKGKKKNQKEEERTKQKIFKLTEITIPESISVKDLAIELKKTSGEVIMKLMSLGIMATLNNDLDFDTAFLVASEFGVTANKKQEVKEEDILFDESEDSEEELVSRPPVVVVMGHVDHGKTSLLDVIRKTNVISGEAGGITQAIGAYKVKVQDREITFLDTPGHEAFTQMRARGAQITDIAILVVAANDGVMPQTVEAINHAKSAGIPIIVAINKIDLPDANPQRVKEELMQYELVPEEWGGDTIFVEISAKKNINIDGLLEMVLLQADVLELKTNPNKQAKGAVIEARLDKNKGTIASVLVQRGTLDVGDTVVVGTSIGRIRSMVNDKGKKVKSAGPSTPVEIMGLTEVPGAGDIFYEVKDEKMAKHLIEKRRRQEREKSINNMQTVTLDNLFGQMEEGKLKQLNLIVKADVQGSVEALKQSLEKLSNDEVRVKVIHSAAGAVTESDVTLATVSNAIIIAFNVRPVATAKMTAEKEEVQIKQYSVIYQAIDDVEAAMKGMLDPKYEEELIGTAEIRQIFKISNVGTIGGAMVLTGKLERNAGIRILRDDVVIHEGKLSSLKRFKDDVKEVAKDFECGIQIEKYNDIQEGDIVEAFIMKEIKR
ncbi:MAG: translation initiation factor IF-2 [Clostridia bacterium]|nr:translation initiation factor IF-2 [Clostridia bacterium]